MSTDGTRNATGEPVEPAEPAPRAGGTPWEDVEPTVEVAAAAPVDPSDAAIAVPEEPEPDLPTARTLRDARSTETIDEDAVDEVIDDEVIDDEAALAGPGAGGGGWWTIPLLCLGIAIIACCMVIPAADDNRRIAYETEKLKVDLAHLEEQISVNDDFLRRLADDPNLSERLARRQMKMVREGTNVMELKGGRADTSLSPFLLVNVPPPPEVPPYRPIGGFLAQLFQHPRTQLYMMGTALLMIAVGLIMGQGGSLVTRHSPQLDGSDRNRRVTQ